VDRLSVEGELAGQKVKMRWGNWHGRDVYPQMKVDPGVELGNGKNLGDAFHIHYWAGLKTPVCITNDVGKGRAVLLNFSIFDAPVDKLVKDMLEISGVKAAVQVAKIGGKGQKGVEATRWTNGGMNLLALLGDYSGEVRVTLPESRFVYDLRSHRPLGNTAEFQALLQANRATFFALSPVEIAPPELRFKPHALRPGEVLQGSVSVPKAEGIQAVMLSATTPSGSPAKWLDATVLAGAKSAPLTLPFACNDPTGEWEVSATELISGLKTTAKVLLR